MPEMNDVCTTCGKIYGKHYLTSEMDCDYPATGRVFMATSEPAVPKFKVGDRVRWIDRDQVGTIIRISLYGNIRLRLDDYHYSSSDDYHVASPSACELLSNHNATVEKLCKNKWCGAKNYLDAKICWKCETVRPAS